MAGTKGIDGKSITEQVIAGGILLGAGAGAALAWEHRSKLKKKAKALFSPEGKLFRKLRRGKRHD